MNIKNFIALTIALLLVSANFTFGQSMNKKYKTVYVELKIDAPAERVWEAMVLDYGEISNFSPYIYTSKYTNDSLKGEVGATRKCNFNAKGSQWSHERIAAIDHENMVMRNIIIEGKKLPLNFDNSQAFYRIKDNGDGTCMASYEFQFRTKPAFMGFLAKDSFRKQLSDTLVGLKHYVETGERVSGGNGKYDEIKNNYPKPTVH